MLKFIWLSDGKLEPHRAGGK